MKKTVIFVSVLALWLLSKVKHNGKSVVDKVKEKVKDKVCGLSVSGHKEKIEEKVKEMENKEEKKETEKMEEKKEVETPKVVGISTTAKPVSAVVSTGDGSQLGVLSGAVVSSSPISTVKPNAVGLSASSIDKDIKKAYDQDPHISFIENEKKIGHRDDLKEQENEPVAPPVVAPVVAPVVDNKNEASEVQPKKPVVIVDPIDDGSGEEERVNPANSSVISPEVAEALEDFNNQDPYERFVEHEGERLAGVGVLSPLESLGFVPDIGLDEKDRIMSEYRKAEKLANDIEAIDVESYRNGVIYPGDYSVWESYKNEYLEEIKPFIVDLKEMKTGALQSFKDYLNDKSNMLLNDFPVSYLWVRNSFLLYYGAILNRLNDAEV